MTVDPAAAAREAIAHVHRTLTEREILTALGRLSTIVWSACGKRESPLTAQDWEIVRDAVERMDRIMSVVPVTRR